MALLKALQDLLQPEIERMSALGSNSVAPVQAGVSQNRPMQTLPNIGRAPYEQQNGFEPMQPGGGRFVTEDNATFYDGQGFSPKPEEPWYKRMTDDPAFLDRLAMGFNTMRLNPDQGLQAVLADRIKTAGELARGEKSKNKTLVALQNMGMSPDEADFLGENPDLLKVATVAMYKKQMGGDPTAEMQTFDYLTRDLSDEDKKKALRIKLGIDPRAASQLSIPLDRFFNQAFQTGAGTQASGAQADAQQAAVANDLLRQQFDFGFSALESALGGTGQTGKIFGNLPAITTSAQIADNAKALLLPIMKGVFRGAGEGVFTDKDQETLEAMLPTRNMTTEAAAQALDSVKMLVSLKLQNPKFDISAYGRSGVGSNQMGGSNALDTGKKTPQAGQQGSSVMDAADAILRGDN